MGKVDWAKIRKDYVSSDVSMRELAEAYGIGLRSVTRKSSADHWVEARDAFRAKVADRVVKRAEDAEVDRNTRHLEVYDKGLAWLESAIQKAKGEADMRAIKDAMAAMKLIQEGQRVALGLDSDQSKLNAQTAALGIVDALTEALHEQTD